MMRTNGIFRERISHVEIDKPILVIDSETKVQQDLPLSDSENDNTSTRNGIVEVENGSLDLNYEKTQRTQIPPKSLRRSTKRTIPPKRLT